MAGLVEAAERGARGDIEEICNLFEVEMLPTPHKQIHFFEVILGRSNTFQYLL
jgi:hypothetical protein